MPTSAAGSCGRQCHGGAGDCHQGAWGPPLRVPPSGTWNVVSLVPEGSPGGASGSVAATGHLVENLLMGEFLGSRVGKIPERSATQSRRGARALGVQLAQTSSSCESSGAARAVPRGAGLPVGLTSRAAACNREDPGATRTAQQDADGALCVGHWGQLVKGVFTRTWSGAEKPRGRGHPWEALASLSLI